MNITNLGFDQWFEDHRSGHHAGWAVARVSAVDRNAYRIINEACELPAELTGKFLHHHERSLDLPCVGDFVVVQYHNNDTEAIIHDVFPRKTFLRRKTAGSAIDFQMIAANIDSAFIVQSCHFDFNPRRLDRYLVMAADGNVEPIVILTKTDLISPEELEQKRALAKSGAPTARVHALSNTSGMGVAELQAMLVPGKTYCLLGSSGVGKTTLINRLLGQDIFDTKAVSETGEGTHTTSRRQLIVLSQGAMLIDTPGMRELGLLGANDGFSQGFDDIRLLSEHCRYANCSHEHEPGCAVRAALTDGSFDKDRYSSYMALKKESDYNEMSYLDKRNKDKAFGRFVKSVKKHMKN